MGQDDDIAAFLPRPPLPAPARREAAMAEALRRFGGGSETPTAASGGGFQAPWRTRFNRSQAGALAGALLVALVAVPLAWTSLPGPVRDAGRPRPTRPAPPAQVAGPAPHVAGPAALPSSPAPADDAKAEAPLAADEAEARVEPPIAPPSPEPPAEEPAAAREPALPAGGSAADQIVVTGSRIRNPNLESAIPLTVVGEQAQARASRSAKSGPNRRGDWNACTIEDPRRDLQACGKLGGRSGAQVADGLARAWAGDLERAADAFDRAIEIAPRSSLAWLNRGLAWRRRGDLDRALADLDKAVRYAPREPRVYYHRSLVLRQKGDIGRAKADEARAVELDPDYATLVRDSRPH